MSTLNPSEAREAQRPDRSWARSALVTGGIAGAVCLFVLTMLVLAVAEGRRLQPLNSPELAAMKAQLLETPNDEALKDRIRQRDEALRQGYFARLRFSQQGAWLLLGAGAALVLALKSYAALTRRPGELQMTRPDPWAEQRMARAGVAVSALLIVGTGGLFAYWQRPALAFGQKDASAMAPSAASDAELAKYWVSFRGFKGNGVVSGSAPEKWDGVTGEGLFWKTKVPLPGNGSPVVFGDLIFLSGSDGETQGVMCFSASSGELKWQVSVPRGTLQKPNIFEDTGFAAPTVGTDGVRVYAIFATGDVAALDFTGRKLWSRPLGLPASTYGYAASLAVWRGNVIVQYDQGGDPEAGRSYLLCLEGATGKPLWKTPRPVANGWASPIVVDDIIYTSGKPWVMAHRAADGKELWRAQLMDGDVASTPVLQEGVLYVGNDHAVAAALRTDGSGDVTASHVKWTNKDFALPDMVSPLTDGKQVLYTHGGGELNCLDAQTGKLLWTHHLQAQVNASPILVGATVYLFDHEGRCHLFELGDQFQATRTNVLGEPVNASPAVANGKLFVRGKDHLYCIGSK